MNHPTLGASIIVPCQGEEFFSRLRRHVPSYTNQITERTYEVIVVAYKDTDVEQWACSYEDVRCVHVPPDNVGNFWAAHARNVGIRFSRGEYILMTDADTRLPPDFLDRGIDVLESGYTLFYSDRAGQDSTSGTMIYRLDDFLEAGAYNEGPGSAFYADDVDLQRRLLEIGEGYQYSGDIIDVEQHTNEERVRRRVRGTEFEYEEDVGLGTIDRYAHRKMNEGVTVNPDGYAHLSSPTAVLADNWLIVGGGDQVSVDALNFLEEAGWNTVLATTRENEHPGFIRPDTDLLALLPELKTNDVNFLGQKDDTMEALVDLCRQRQADLVITNLSLVALRSLKQLSQEFPVLSIIHDRMGPIPHLLVENKEYADCICGVSEAITSYLNKQGVSEDKLQVCHWTPWRFPKEATQRQRGRERYGIPDDAVVVNVTCRHAVRKQVSKAIDAVSRVSGEPWLIIAGEGPRSENLARAATEKGIGTRTVMTGPLSRRGVAETMAASDIGLLASSEEGCTFALQEMMTLGRPVVAFSAGGLPELIRHGRDGFLAPPGDVRLLSEQLERLVSDDKARQQMGEAARRRVQNKFNREDLRERWTRIATGVAREPGTAPPVQRRKRENPETVLVGGLPRSGTSYLNLVISQFQGVRTTHELNLWGTQPGGEGVHGREKHVGDILHRLKRRLGPDTGPFNSGLGYKMVPDPTVEVWGELGPEGLQERFASVETQQELVDCVIDTLWQEKFEVVGDKMPGYGLHLQELLKTYSIDHVFIAVRDPLQLTQAWLRPRQIEGGSFAQNWLGTEDPADVYRGVLSRLQNLYEEMREVHKRGREPVAVHLDLWEGTSGQEKAVSRLSDRLRRKKDEPLRVVKETADPTHYDTGGLWGRIEPHLSDDEKELGEFLTDFVRDVGGLEDA